MEVGSHRHMIEIDQELSKISKNKDQSVFYTTSYTYV